MNSNSLRNVWGQLSARQRRILILLFRCEGGTSTKQLADGLGISSPTIRAEFAMLTELLSKTSVGVQRNSDQSITILVPHADDRAFLQVQSYLPQSECFDKRKTYIALRLLLNKRGPLTEGLLGQQLFVSRTSISNEIDYLTEWFAEFHLKLYKKKNYGIYLQGTELDRRNALVAIFQYLSSNSDFSRENNPGTEVGYHLILQEICPGFDGPPIDELIHQLERADDITLQESVYATLWFSLSAAVFRMRTGHFLSFGENQPPPAFDFLMPPAYVVPAIEKAYQIHIPPDEASYLSLLIKSSGLGRSREGELQGRLHDKTFETFLQSVINTIEPILDISFDSNPELREHFAYHLSCTVMRLKYGIRIQNLLLPEIKINYPSVLAATWASSVLFEKYYGFKVTEDEIGFLALYVGTYVLETRQVVRACVVCNYGIGVTGLLSESLSYAIPNLAVVDALSSKQYKSLRLTGSKGWDVVITTLNLEETDIPMIRVSSILSQEDLGRIKRFIRDLTPSETLSSRLYAQATVPLFYEALFFCDFPAKDKDAAIRHACQRLKELGYVSSAFLNSVLEREHVITTEVGSGIAIPHGNPQLVNHPAIVAIKLRSPVFWGNNQMVDLIFVLALRMDPESGELQSAKRFYKKLAYILDDAEECRRFKQISDGKVFCSYFDET